MGKSIINLVLRTIYWELRAAFVRFKSTLRWLRNFHLHILFTAWLAAVFSLYGPIGVLQDLGLVIYQDSFRSYAGVAIIVSSAIFITRIMMLCYSLIIKLLSIFSTMWKLAAIKSQGLIVIRAISERIANLSIKERIIISDFRGEQVRFLAPNGHLDILETAGIITSTARLTQYDEREYIITDVAWNILKKKGLIEHKTLKELQLWTV